MIVPVAPGGGADIVTRALAQKMVEAWGQQVIVDNRAGAGGIVGLEITSRAAPDGYTIAQGGVGPLAVNPSLHSKLAYRPLEDFTHITRAVSALNVLVVHPSVPVNSVKDLIVYTKANPSKSNFGSSGAGRADHLAGELFNMLAGVRMQHVPYKGGAPAMVDLVSGNLQLIFATVSTAAAHMKSGRIWSDRDHLCEALRPLPGSAHGRRIRCSRFCDRQLVLVRCAARTAAPDRREAAPGAQSHTGAARCQGAHVCAGHRAVSERLAGGVPQLSPPRKCRSTRSS